MNPKPMLKKLEAHYFRVASEIELMTSLYGDAEHIEVLNDLAHETFARLQRPLIDSIIMGICRMYDPAKNRSQDNLTFFQLANQLPPGRKTAKFLSLITRQKSRMKSIIKLRHKIIGHSDLVKAGKSVIKYSGASRRDITKYSEFIHESLHCAHDALGIFRATYIATLHGEGNPDQFIDWIRNAKLQLSKSV